MSGLLSWLTGSSQNMQPQEMLSRDNTLTFIKKFLEVLSQQETKMELRRLAQSGKDPADYTTELQEKIFQEMSIAPGHGVACLGQIGKVFRQDSVVMAEFQKMIQLEQQACDEAEMTEAQLQSRQHMISSLDPRQREMLEKVQHMDPQERQTFMEQMQAHVQAQMQAQMQAQTQSQMPSDPSHMQQTSTPPKQYDVMHDMK